MKFHPKLEPQFPWREGNRVELLVDAEMFFPAMLRAVHEARNCVWLEMYLFESGAVADQFIDAFIDAARRGVQVCLLLDDFGCRKLSQQDRSRLAVKGIALAFYNPLHYGKWRRNLFRDHRKILLVDHQAVFVGGTGLTDDFAPRLQPELAWRETMVRVEGPCVVDWAVLFAHTWGSGYVARAPLRPGPQAIPALPEGLRGRVVETSALSSQELSRSLLNRIRLAQQNVWLTTAYFVPSIKIRRALRKTAQRGVDVRLLLPGNRTDHPAVRHAGRRFYHGMLRAGVRIFEYQPRFIHAKVVICDSWVSVGSSNIDRWNLRWNLEANQESVDDGLAQQAREMFERDFVVSEEIQFEAWRTRSWRSQIREWFWGRIDEWVDRFSR